MSGISIDPRVTYVFGKWTSLLLMIAAAGPIFFDGALPPWIIPIIVKWCAILGAVNSVILTSGSGLSSSAAGPWVGPTPPPAIPPTIVKLLILAFLPLALLAMAAGPVQAQTRHLSTPTPAMTTPAPAQLLPLTGNGAQDLANLLKRFTITPAPTTPDEIQATSCDLTILSKLTIDNVVPLLQKCMQAVGNGLAAPLVADTQTALDSARAFNCGTTPSPSCVGNGMAIACLVPALSLFKAAEGTAAIKDANGVVTTPAVAAGVITIGEKLDEFVQSGGPSNCKTVVQRVTAGLAAAAMTP